MKHVIALVLALTFNATANLMMRVGAKRLGESGLSLEQGVGPMISSVLSNWVLILGLCCFATNVIFYAYALSGPNMQISVAYPIMVGGGFAIIAVVAWRALGESLTGAQWAGVALIMIGLFLVARQMNATHAT
jgi:small multidrug resistance pump